MGKVERVFKLSQKVEKEEEFKVGNFLVNREVFRMEPEAAKDRHVLRVRTKRLPILRDAPSGRTEDARGLLKVANFLRRLLGLGR